jgi:hypothetical protein
MDIKERRKGRKRKEKRCDDGRRGKEEERMKGQKEDLKFLHLNSKPIIKTKVPDIFYGLTIKRSILGKIFELNSLNLFVLLFVVFVVWGFQLSPYTLCHSTCPFL